MNPTRDFPSLAAAPAPPPSTPRRQHNAAPAVLHEFFERAVQRWPDRVAVDVPPGHDRPARALITYAELDHAANALARRLRPLIRGECVVAVLLPRASADLYVAQLAILKAGAAYTCLDPAFPDERAREILTDARASVLLTDGPGFGRARGFKLESLRVLPVSPASEPPRDADAELSGAGSTPALTPERLAYIIYTSGTTGRPKGVMIEHRSIVNLVASDIEVFHLSPADRVAQNSSAAYDSSVEEIWLAFAAGAALVVVDEDTVRLGPDLVAWMRRERITVFCPPPTLLRAMGCKHPQTELPDLKLVYVGGEPLPRDVADRWSPGGTLVNSYGPTECTVTCLRERIAPGQPIPIGLPVPGVKGWVLNEAFAEVARGERGELCIGGVSLARGYWQRPDLTAEKFIVHPRLGRIYRTGDLVHQDEAGQFYYHDRIDAQVKLRGYRIELGEIESRLTETPGVRAAACYVYDNDGHATLAAAIVPDDATRAPSPDELQVALRAALPDYMVPARITFLPGLPTTVSGKLDRAALPRPKAVETRADRECARPRNSIEAKIDGAFAGILRRGQNLSIHEDFFRDLGGDSLGAAQVVSVLRDDPATAWATVRDLYEAPTIASLARRAPRGSTTSAATPSSPPEGIAPPTRAVPRWTTTLLQTGCLMGGIFIGSALTCLAAFHVLPRALAMIGVVPLLFLTPPLVLAGLALYTALAVQCAAVVKKLLIGRYAPLRAPVWGGFYLRNWIVQKAVRLIPWWLIQETEFQNAALRALGGRIGRRVHLHRGVDLLRGGWDLLAIGDDVTIGRDAALELVRFEAGEIVIGAVALAHGVTLETHACVGMGAAIEPNGLLAARSWLPRGYRIPAGERWDGIPARPAGTAPEPPAVPAGAPVTSPRANAVAVVLARLALSAVLLFPLELLAIALGWMLGLDADAVTAWTLNPTIDLRMLCIGSGMAVLPVPCLLGAQALTCRAIGRIHPGVISRWSPGYIRITLKTALVDSGSRWLYGTLLWPLWLRLAGMKIGRGCEISSLIDTIPELVEIGDRTFCADGIYIAGPQIHRGTVELLPVRLGRNNFIGNGAIIPGGTRQPDDVLLGVCTVAHESFLRPGTSWFGHPPFEMSRRVTADFDRGLTHHPTAIRYMVRVFWELLRFTLPVALAVIAAVWYALLTMAGASLPLAGLLLAAIPLLNIGALMVPAVLMMAIKWTLLGRVRPATHPLWSAWASRWDFVCLTWTIYAADMAALLDGTPALAWLLRAAGVRVGRGVVFGTGFAEDIPDPDMLVFEDGATVDCQFQAHTFEDRVLKLGYITVRRNATVDRNAVLLYGADIGAGTRVAPNSIVMKHEHLLPGLRYAGAPTREEETNWFSPGA